MDPTTAILTYGSAVTLAAFISTLLLAALAAWR